MHHVLRWHRCGGASKSMLMQLLTASMQIAKYFAYYVLWQARADSATGINFLTQILLIKF
jgi:hypothetical protein